ncbi:unnamed protein product [Linum tenue]|uniref:Uncharacterized protein n=1 Tax=Linum tenue TaxID=586396 RepID=A0AAV0L6R8_9ROSI|nr:unnamed protein product [Linum tenue]
MRLRYEQWMTRYGRVYGSSREKEVRYQIFKDNAALVDSFNAAGDKPYKLGTNQFADLTNEEFKTTRCRFKGHMCSLQEESFRYENVSAVPTAMDWRKKGAVTPIKDQGQCGSCWAFSAVGAMEGITQLSTGKLISLSEQELVDCDTKGEDQGCGETNYPYTTADGSCSASKEGNPAATIKGYEDVPANNEVALMKAVSSQPISVAIDAGDSSFQLYESGIFTGECGTELDHGVTAVGYGESGGMKY